MQTLVSLTDTSSPAQWSSRADNWHPCCAQNLQKFERFPVKGDLKAVSVSHTPYSRISSKLTIFEYHHNCDSA
jgi:hypothetical protein